MNKTQIKRLRNNATQRRHRLKYKEEFKLRRQLPEQRYWKAKASAKTRGISWELTFDQFLGLIGRDCVYCDGYFPQVTAGLGLDRIDNTVGYTAVNLTPCCKHCNSLKLDCHTPEETRAMVQLLIEMRRPKFYVVKEAR